jgi:glutamate/aspartate transport system substrate-binding protein
MKVLKLIAVLIGAGVVVGAVHAEELTGTLKKIKDTGTITLGVRDSSIPFSYLDDKQSYQGYSIDLCLKAVTAVQKHLGLTSLNVKMNPVTSATRIPLMANGTVDLECGSTTNNLERQKQVAFAPTTFVTANRLLSKKSSNINTLSDMKGKALVSTSGTSNLKQLTRLNGEQNLDMNIMTAKDHAEAFLMVETGRAVAFGMDDILLASLAASSKSPADYTISSEALSVEPYGIMMRRDDPAFKKVVDGAIEGVFKSGEINKIYAKWFQSAIPPKGINLNIPMSVQLKAAIAHPTDSGDPATYAAMTDAHKMPVKK